MAMILEVTEALESSFSWALIKKKERVIGVISKPKTRPKFLAMIYHELEDCLNSGKKVESLSARALSMPCYEFEPLGVFGRAVNSPGDALSNCDDPFLLVSSDGKYAIYGPETFMDGRSFYAL
jgi:hypothetical protein